MTDTTTKSVRDSYRLNPEDVKEPPLGWRASFRFLGPGLILSAAIVGSGELIATTALGAEIGFVLLWLVFFSTLVKVAVQVELARWSIVTGKPALEGYNQVPPRIGRVSWVALMWIIFALLKVIQAGGVVGGAAAALSVLFPIVGEPLSFESIALWTAVVVVGAVVSLYSNKYSLIERGAVSLTLVFVLITAGLAVALFFDPAGYDIADLATGLQLSLPAGAVGAAIAMFGVTGVTSEQITAYTYWCIEKGYARWTGPNDGTAAWKRRANGWIRVMYKDAMLSWCVYTLSTVCFYIMGAAVLRPKGLIPSGNEMITTLQHIYTETLGDWGAPIFLIGAVAVLGSTVWASVPAWARAGSNALAVCGVFNWHDPTKRMRWNRILTVVLPIVWGITFLFIQSPVIMIQTGGFVGGVFLVATVIATWYLRKQDVGPEVRGGWWFTAALAISSLMITGLGIYSAVEVFGISIG